MDGAWTPVFHAIPDEQTSTIYLIGDFGEAGVADFERAIERLDDVGGPEVTIDMSDVTSLHLAGVACLLRAQLGALPVHLEHVPRPV